MPSRGLHATCTHFIGCYSHSELKFWYFQQKSIKLETGKKKNSSLDLDFEKKNLESVFHKVGGGVLEVCATNVKFLDIVRTFERYLGFERISYQYIVAVSKSLTRVIVTKSAFQCVLYKQRAVSEI